MKNILVAVDMQRDFVDGALGTAEARAIVPAAVEKIKGFAGEIFVTLDTHKKNYLSTPEGKKLPVPHCIKGGEGWRLCPDIEQALAGKAYTAVEKSTFGSVRLPGMIRRAAKGEKDLRIEFIGLCTDICVISNALIVKAHFPGAEIVVDSACCAGVTPALHNAALAAMQSCQIEVI